jgi:hypothetical protein
METPEGQTIVDWIKSNRILNLDIDSMYSRGTLLFLQFNNLIEKVSDLESKLIRMKQMLENNAHTMREIKRLLH